MALQHFWLNATVITGKLCCPALPFLLLLQYGSGSIVGSCSLAFGGPQGFGRYRLRLHDFAALLAELCHKSCECGLPVSKNILQQLSCDLLACRYVLEVAKFRTHHINGLHRNSQGLRQFPFHSPSPGEGTGAGSVGKVIRVPEP